MKPGPHHLTEIDLDTIHKALSGLDLRDYVAEVLWLTEKLGLPDPDWFSEGPIREQVERYRSSTPDQAR